MGLVSYYVGYKRAQKKAQRRQQREEWRNERVCSKCGHQLQQHSTTGQCPRYE